MARINRFEDIEAWQQARELTAKIYRLTNNGDFARDYGLRDQIRRASVSVMSNIAEGFERGGDREFQQFLSLAKASLGEVRSQLYVALDAGFLNESEYDTLHQLTLHTAGRIGAFMRYLKHSNFKGNKYRDPENTLNE